MEKHLVMKMYLFLYLLHMLKNLGLLLFGLPGVRIGVHALLRVGRGGGEAAQGREQGGSESCHGTHDRHRSAWLSGCASDSMRSRSGGSPVMSSTSAGSA
mgnify:CR=1 FL=1